MSLRYPKYVAFVITSGFIFSLAYSFYFQIEPVVDARAYDTIAWNIVKGVGYAETPEVPRDEDYSIGRVGPAYEVFLAVIYAFFGHHLAVVWIIQAILHAGSGFLIFLIARRLFGFGDSWFGDMAGFVAASLFVFFIDIVELSSMLMTETLLLFLSIFSLFLFIRFFHAPTLVNAAYLGVAATLAAMTRPTLFLFLVVFLAFCFSRRYYRHTLVLVGCFVVLMAPWGIRNYRIFDKVILTGAAGGYDLWVGNNPVANGELEPAPFIKEYSATHSIFETHAEGLRRVKQFVLTEPLSEAKLLFLKTSIYFSAARPAAFWFHLHGISRFLTVIFSSSFAFLLFVFGFAGARFLFYRKEKIFFWLTLLAAAMPLSVIPIVVETRYRYAFYPFLALASGYLVALLVRNYRRSKEVQKENREAALHPHLDGCGGVPASPVWLFLRANRSELFTLLFAAALVSVNTLFDLLRNLSRVQEKLGG